MRDTDKSQYFVITEFNNCFFIRSPRSFVFFNEYLTFCHFKARAIARRSTVCFHLRMNSIFICSQTQMGDIARKQTSICRQLSAGHLEGS